MSVETLRLSSNAAHALWADSYDENPNPLLAIEERTVGPLLSRMEGMSTVDVACGTGRWLAHLIGLGAATAVGLDCSPAMLKRASAKANLSGCLVESDAAAIPLREACADFAICSFGLSYMADLTAFAGELSRVVRSGGTVVLSDLHPTAQAKGWRRSFRHNGAVVEISSFPRSAECVLESFAAEGFEPVARFEPCFGEPERTIFERAGKEDSFKELCQQPAIYVFVLTRKGRSRPASSVGAVYDHVCPNCE